MNAAVALPGLAAAAAAVALALVVRPFGSARVPPWLLVAAAAAAVTVASIAVPVAGVGLVFAAGVALGAGTLWRLHRERREAERRSEQLLEACGVLAAELSAGQPATVALAQAAEGWAHLAPAAEAASLGADVPTSLRTLAGARGARDLVLVAAAWQVAHHTGQGLAAALGVVVEDLRALRETRRVVASELASARATARLVAALPVAVLAMGRGAGGDPVGFLLREPLGWLCAALGMLLLAAGLAWIEVIARSVEAEGSR